MLVSAAVTAETVRWTGAWADGLITLHKPFKELKEVVDGFRQNGGKGKPVYLKVRLSYAATDEEALKRAHDQWRTDVFSGTVLGDLSRVEQFDAWGEFAQLKQMHGMVRIFFNIQKRIYWVTQDLELGFDKIILHNVNREQELFINDVGEKLLLLFNSAFIFCLMGSPVQKSTSFYVSAFGRWPYKTSSKTG